MLSTPEAYKPRATPTVEVQLPARTMGKLPASRGTAEKLKTPLDVTLEIVRLEPGNLDLADGQPELSDGGEHAARTEKAGAGARTDIAKPDVIWRPDEGDRMRRCHFWLSLANGTGFRGVKTARWLIHSPFGVIWRGQWLGRCQWGIWPVFRVTKLREVRWAVAEVGFEIPRM